MRDFCKIPPTIWRRQDFRAISKHDDARFLYLYLLTSPHANSVGCFVCPLGYIMGDLGRSWTIGRIEEALDVLIKEDLIGRDAETDTIRISGFFAEDAPTNDKHAKGSFRLASKLPDSELKYLVLKDLTGLAFSSGLPEVGAEYRRLSEMYGYAIDREPQSFAYTDTETEIQTETKTITASETPPGNSLQVLDPGSCETGVSRPFSQGNRKAKSQETGRGGLKQLSVLDALPAGCDSENREAFALYNAMARSCGLPIAEVLTARRNVALARCLREVNGLEGWRRALSKIETSEFCRGSGDRGWKVSIDYLLKPENIMKVMEGNYDPPDPSKSKRRGGSL